jgi:hypothetical protein
LETSNELSYEKGGTFELFWMVLVGLDLKFVDLEIPSHDNGTMVCLGTFSMRHQLRLFRKCVFEV